MCGIFGIIRRGGLRPEDRETIGRLARSLVHRGPDGEGFHVSGPVGLGLRGIARPVRSNASASETSSIPSTRPPVRSATCSSSVALSRTARNSFAYGIPTAACTLDVASPSRVDGTETFTRYEPVCAAANSPR